MSDKIVGARNLYFLLFDVFAIEGLTSYSYYGEHNNEIFKMVIDTALKIGKDLMRPHLQEMDQNTPQYMDGEVKVHPFIKEYLKECGEGGWIGMNAPYEIGGPTTSPYGHLCLPFHIFRSQLFRGGLSYAYRKRRSSHRGLCQR